MTPAFRNTPISSQPGPFMALLDDCLGVPPRIWQSKTRGALGNSAELPSWSRLESWTPGPLKGMYGKSSLI